MQINNRLAENILFLTCCFMFGQKIYVDISIIFKMYKMDFKMLYLQATVMVLMKMD